MVALFIGAVMQQQFGRAEGVGHHHGGGQVAAARGELHRNLGVGVGREAFAAVFLGNDQREEAMGLDVFPGSGRKVHGLADFPIADHCTEFFGGAIDECLLFFGQLRLGVGQQLVPVGAATEQFAVPPHGAGIDRVALGFGHRRQHFLKPAEQRLGEVLPAQVRQQQGQGNDGDHHPEDQQQPTRCMAPGAHRQQVNGDHAQGGQGRGAAVCQVGNADHQNQYPQQQHIQSSVKPGAKPPWSLVGIRKSAVIRV